VAKKDSIAVWEKQMAEQAEVAAKMEAGVGGGQFFKLQGGTLSFGGAPMPDNRMAVIILGSILENVHYEGAYDPESNTGPDCFAFGTTEEEMIPHKDVVDPVHPTCTGCPNNQWGTADRGKGKACRNTRRLAVIPAGILDKAGDFEAFENAGDLESEPIAYLKLPITSVRGYATMVKQVAGVFKRPPHGVFTKVEVIPDEKTQFKVVFETLGKVPNKLLSLVMERHAEAVEAIDFPYTPPDDDDVKPQKRKKNVKKAAAKKPARKARRKF